MADKGRKESVRNQLPICGECYADHCWRCEGDCGCCHPPVEECDLCVGVGHIVVTGIPSRCPDCGGSGHALWEFS